MEMIQNGIAEGLMETIRRDHCEQGVPVIGCEQSAKEVDAINMPDLLDIAAQEPRAEVPDPKKVNLDYVLYVLGNNSCLPSLLFFVSGMGEKFF